MLAGTASQDTKDFQKILSNNLKIKLTEKLFQNIKNFQNHSSLKMKVKMNLTYSIS